MWFSQLKKLCSVTILVFSIHAALSVTASIGGSSSLPTCKTEPLSSLIKRQDNWNGLDNGHLVSSVGNSSGCPSTRQIAYIGIAADCSYAAEFNSTASARQHIREMVQTASVVYENSFNISLEIRNLTIRDSECPSGSGSGDEDWNASCSTGNLNSRLRQFSTWRSSQNDNNAYWTLLTGCSDAGEVGVSWVGALCNARSASGYSGAGANVVARTQSEWEVFAHESAHTMGAVHDCTSSTCASSPNDCCPLSSSTCDADGEYIMNPTSRSGMTRFSSCTIGAVCSRFGSGEVRTDCLVDSRSANTTGSDGTCGNGIVEPGEACDCGNNACSEEDTKCCDSLTCQSKGGRQCRSGGGGSGGGSNGGNNSPFGGSQWWSDHKREVIIGLAVGIGGSVLLAILICMMCSCRRKRQRTAPVPKVPSAG